MKNKSISALEEENQKLKAEIRALNREIGHCNRTITAMENNFNIKMNMFRALAAANERHQRFLTHMMKNSADFIILLDKELNVAYCSDLFLNKIGMDFFIEIEGKDIFEVYKKLDSKELLKMLKENLYMVLTSNKTCRHDILYDIEGNGEMRTFRITNTPMIDEDTGVTSGIIIIWSDTAEITSINNDTENRSTVKHEHKPANKVKKPLPAQTTGKKADRHVNKQTDKRAEAGLIKKEDLPDIPGIDMHKGVELTGGSVEGYLMVLSIFCRDILKRIFVLKSAPSLEKLPSYTMELGSISVSAAAIGVFGLSEEAARLKTAAEKGNMPYIQEKLEDFVKHLEELVENIQKIL